MKKNRSLFGKQLIVQQLYVDIGFNKVAIVAPPLMSEVQDLIQRGFDSDLERVSNSQLV